MASAFTHAFVAVAAGKMYARNSMPWRFWVTSIALSILPDLDVIGFAFGIRYGDVFGHRGFSHSIVFAAMAGAAVLPSFSDRSWRLWLYFTVVTASHGFLDAMTDGGLGIAFFSPFDTTRYFLPWTPVRVSPIGVGAFFSLWGLGVMLSEVSYIWAPVTLVWAGVRLARGSRRGRARLEDGMPLGEASTLLEKAGAVRIPETPPGDATWHAFRLRDGMEIRFSVASGEARISGLAMRGPGREWTPTRRVWLTPGMTC